MRQYAFPQPFVSCVKYLRPHPRHSPRQIHRPPQPIVHLSRVDRTTTPTKSQHHSTCTAVTSGGRADGASVPHDQFAGRRLRRGRRRWRVRRAGAGLRGGGRPAPVLLLLLLLLFHLSGVLLRLLSSDLRQLRHRLSCLLLLGLARMTHAAGGMASSLKPERSLGAKAAPHAKVKGQGVAVQILVEGREMGKLLRGVPVQSGATWWAGWLSGGLTSRPNAVARRTV